MSLLELALWIAALSSGHTQQINQPNYAPAPCYRNMSISVSDVPYITAPTTLAQLMPTPISTAPSRSAKKGNRKKKARTNNNLALMRRPSTALMIVS